MRENVRLDTHAVGARLGDFGVSQASPERIPPVLLPSPERRTAPAAVVADEHFILATRDSGYRDAAAAIAELVDNSLQAGARRIAVRVREDRPEPRAAERYVTVAVLDDGRGMSPDTLRTALRFGGTDRFNDRSGIGRFGMGLPNSSVSQTRRLEVYSWREPEAVAYSYLDVDEVAAGTMRVIPAPVPRALPDWLGTLAAPSGTLVVWSRCDRLARHRVTTVAARLRATLGRLYRYAIWDGVAISVNDDTVAAVDPLFLDPRAERYGAAPYGPPLRFEVALPNHHTSVVEVRFSELPVAAWQAWTADEKRRAGVVGGAGVSVVRAGREIDYGWHLMGGKRRENYDDWWRCEVRFEPVLDEWFGVTHSKQGVTPTPELRALLGEDLGPIARTLNARVRVAFERLHAACVTADSPAADAAAAGDPFLPPFRVGDATVGGVRYRIEHAPLSGPEFYHARLTRGTVVLTLNDEHPFYTRVYEPVCRGGATRERYHLECLLLAAARADLDAPTGRSHATDDLERRRRAWSDALAAFVGS